MMTLGLLLKASGAMLMTEAGMTARTSAGMQAKAQVSIVVQPEGMITLVIHVPMKASASTTVVCAGKTTDAIKSTLRLHSALLPLAVLALITV